MSRSNYYHAHRIITDRCDGRLKCIRNCPTQSLRVRTKKNVEFLGDLCIDCGICINVCPENVYEPISDKWEDFQSFKYKIAIPSNILYPQFDPNLPPIFVHMALKQIGFDAVEDVSRMCNEVGSALVYHLETHPDIRPLISSFCPSIVRFIQVSYPNLVKNIVPLDVPREILAKSLKKSYSQKLGLKEEEIGIIYISPCTSKIVSIKQPAEKERSWIDGAIPIRDIYNRILPIILKLKESGIVDEQSLHLYGKSWGMLGHFSQQVRAERCLSVAGIDHVKQILDDLESTKLHNIDFLEALSCMHGCVNGVFCVKDPYVARHNSILMQRNFSTTEALDEEEVIKKYKAGVYRVESQVRPRPTRSSEPTDIAASIKRMKKKERIYSKLPKNDCGLCGAPTCETFAEDCARNEADLTECIFFSK